METSRLETLGKPYSLHFPNLEQVSNKMNSERVPTEEELVTRAQNRHAVSISSKWM